MTLEERKCRAPVGNWQNQNTECVLDNGTALVTFPESEMCAVATQEWPVILAQMCRGEGSQS